MEEELNGSITKTQLLLGKFVKRPSLTDKLLKKPPFRFLHDIITTVLKTTGFFEGLFDQEELISDNVKDRESKILFLSKVITVLEVTAGKTLYVKPSKIVAGQEPAKTNELLQCLGEVLGKKLSSADAVRKYKENANTSKVTNKKHDVKKGFPKDQSVVTNEKDKKTIPKLRLKEKTSIKADSPPKTSSNTSVKKRLVKHLQNLEISSLNPNPKNDNIPDFNQIKKPEKILNNSETNERKQSVGHDISEDKSEQPLRYNKEEETNVDKNESVDKNHSSELKSGLEKVNELDKGGVDNETNYENIIIKEEQYKKNIVESSKIDNRESEELRNAINTDIVSSESDNVKTIEKRPVSVRPPSSRPGAPRVKERHDTTSVGSETPIMHKVNIIVENVVPEEDEYGSIIIVDKQTSSGLQNEEQIQLSSNEHSHLVQQILDSQKEFSYISGKTEIEWQFGAQKARDTVNQEIEQMRFNVQALSRISNPLGKLIDHIQEDVEVMRQELQEWTRKYEHTSKELSRQKVLNLESLHPLQAKIKQVDADIVEKRDKINDLRIVVYKNYYRIEKLLSSGNVQ